MMKSQSRQHMGEQIVREVKLVGNGAHIFVPKEWAGEQIVLIREPKAEIRERIFEVLDGHLDKIKGVYLYGSFARREADESSDIDLLIISDEKLVIKKEGFEIICISEKELERMKGRELILFYAILTEAKPIINSSLLEELRVRYRIKDEDIRKFILQTKKMIGKEEELLELDEKAGEISAELIYSILLRLRGIFIIKCLVKGESYNHMAFGRWLSINGIKGSEYEKAYESYRMFKSGKSVKVDISFDYIEKMIELLKKEAKDLEYEKGKKAKKRN